MLSDPRQTLDLIDDEAQEDSLVLVKRFLNFVERLPYKFTAFTKEFRQERGCIKLDQFGPVVLSSQTDCQLLGQRSTKGTFPCARWAVEQHKPIEPCHFRSQLAFGDGHCLDIRNIDLLLALKTYPCAAEISGASCEEDHQR